MYRLNSFMDNKEEIANLEEVARGDYLPFHIFLNYIHISLCVDVPFI
jgi:hypothetical protein